MHKQQTIEELLALQQRIVRAIAPYVIEVWRKLNVPLAQLKSLQIINLREGTNYKALAHDLNVTPGDVTGIVDRLVEQGLVVRVPNPDDRRVTWLETTEKGRELLTNLIDSRSRHMIKIMEFMQEEDLAALLRGTTAFIHTLEEHQREILKQE